MQGGAQHLKNYRAEFGIILMITHIFNVILRGFTSSFTRLVSLVRPLMRSQCEGPAYGRLPAETFAKQLDISLSRLSDSALGRSALILLILRLIRFYKSMSYWTEVCACLVVAAASYLRSGTDRVITSRSLDCGETKLFLTLPKPAEYKWREPTSGVKVVDTSFYAREFAAQFNLELSNDGYYVEGCKQVLVPKVASCMIGSNLYLYPERRHVINSIGMFDLIDIDLPPTKTRLHGISIGFVGTVWGLVDNDSYARCRNMTFISNDSGFNAVTEIKSSMGRSWMDVWTMAYITEERRKARESIPDMPESTRVRPPKSYASALWEFTNRERAYYGMAPIGENSFQVSYFSGVEMFVNGDIRYILNSVPIVNLQPVSNPPEGPDPIISSTIAGPSDLKPVNEDLVDAHVNLEVCSEDQLHFQPGIVTMPAVEYIVDKGKVVMNPQVLVSELTEDCIKYDYDDWKSNHNRGVVFGSAFGKLGYSPAPTSTISLLTEKVRQKVLKPATKKVDLSLFGQSTLDIRTLKIALPKFDPIAIDSIGENEKDLRDRIIQMNSSKTRARMSKTLSEFYGCEIEVMRLQRSHAKFDNTEKVFAKLVDVKVKIFTKGDELIMKPKPRSIKFPQSWYWLVTVLNLEAQIAAIKSDEHWSWRPDPEVPFRLYWASGMTQERLSRAWTHAINQLPDSNGEHGELFAFICGDDNSDELGAADASSYDMTQRKFFASCQFSSMDGFERLVHDSLKKIHKGRRQGKGFNYFQKQMGNPSGSPFTLFINTIGMGLYTLERARLRLALQKSLKRELTSSEMETLSKEVGKGYGLEITYTPAPSLDTVGSGVEFLKGVFIPFTYTGESSNQSLFMWVPLPSRVVKSGKIIVDDLKLPVNRMWLEEQLSSVANSFVSAVIPPILDHWVEVWKRPVKTTLHKDWMNISYENSEEFLKFKGYPALLTEMTRVLANRYGYSIQEFTALGELIKGCGRQFGHFTGGLWERLTLVDYQGQAFQC